MDITLIKQGQHTIHTTLSALTSKSDKTLLYFYPKDDTPGCTIEAKDFSDLVHEFAGLSIQIVGVSKDSEQSHCDFYQTQGLGIDLISDPELILHKHFDTRGEKKNYGQIYQGVIRSTFLLDNKGNILQSRKNVKATGHAARILKAVSK